MFKKGIKEYLLLYLPWFLAFIVTIFLVIWLWRYIEPPPPREVCFAAGKKEGRYYKLAIRYSEALYKKGLVVNVIETDGTRENLKLLNDGLCDIGFAQGGVGSPEIFPNVRSLASLFYEPLWILLSKGSGVEYIGDLKGKKVSIGTINSGTYSLALKLLNLNGLNSSNTDLLTLDAKTAVDKLLKREIDAVFIVISADSVLLRNFLKNGLEILDIKRVRAYTSRLRFLTSLVVGEGVLDVQANIPQRAITIISPVATLVVSSKFHPALIPLILGEMKEIHFTGGLLEKEEEFPSSRLLDFPQPKTARIYLERGPGLLYRIIPSFWLASLIDRLKILFIPLLTLMFPLFKVIPPLYRWGIRRRIYKWYKVLREIELSMRKDKELKKFEELLKEVEKIEQETSKVKVPLSYMEELYHLHMHVDLIRKKLISKINRLRHEEL